MSELVVFEYQGSEVVFDAAARMWNLNAMHRAAGNVRSKEPARWLISTQAQELIKVIHGSDTRISGIATVYETRKGGDEGGGTWACIDLAIVYAHYLSPKFYVQWNRWTVERMQQIIRSSPNHLLLTSSVDALDAAVEAISRTLDACFIIAKGSGYLRDHEIMQVLEYHGMLPHLHIPVLIERRKANAFYLSAVSAAMIVRGVHYSPIKNHVIYLGIAPRDPVIAGIIEDTRGEKAVGKRAWQRMKNEGR